MHDFSRIKTQTVNLKDKAILKMDTSYLCKKFITLVAGDFVVHYISLDISMLLNDPLPIGSGAVAPKTVAAYLTAVAITDFVGFSRVVSAVVFAGVLGYIASNVLCKRIDDTFSRMTLCKMINVGNSALSLMTGQLLFQSECLPEHYKWSSFSKTQAAIPDMDLYKFNFCLGAEIFMDSSMLKFPNTR
jgi:hypothetical protein